MSTENFLAATNMLAISFSRRDKKQASAILSDAIAIAGVLGCALAIAMFICALEVRGLPSHCQHAVGGACWSAPLPVT